MIQFDFIKEFNDEAFYDNHTHLLFTDKPSVTVEEFALNYYHGIRDAQDAEGAPCPSGTAFGHMKYQAVIQTLVHAMSQRFGCGETLEDVVAFRNGRTKTPEGLKAYTKMLYEDQRVSGCTLDNALPMGHPDTLCFPCPVNRLFQYENVLFDQVKEAGSYDAALQAVLEAVTAAAKEGFAGLKGHIGEKCGFAVREVPDEEARSAFGAARKGDKAAVTTVYYAIFSHLLERCAELDIPLHLHTGSTGFKGRTDFYTLDPILMAPFLKNPRYLKTKIVLLHESFPYTRHAAMMACNFPNVYLDLSQTLPWQPLLFSRCLEDALSVTPHDKIMLGTGQHWYAEMVWLAAYIAKRSLARVMGTFVEDGLLSGAQARRSARMVLSGNAHALYHMA